jgi:sigma-B regulation protein RsbU (phosphoserine phosphatase)
MLENICPAQHADGNNPAGSASNEESLQAWDLEAASRVQRKLFPERMPEASGWEFAALCRPARLLAGDYYDIFDLAPGRVGLALGDVAGKGLGPSLVTASLHAMIRGHLPQHAGGLPRLMRELNQYFFSCIPDDMFVTLFLAVLDEETGRLTYVNAGHPHPVLVMAEGQGAVRLPTAGALLGVLPDLAYTAGEVHLQPGSVLALFSDGVIDARNENGETFQEQRIIELLSGAGSLSAAAVLARMLAAVERFVGMSQLRDDIAVMIVRRESI